MLLIRFKFLAIKALFQSWMEVVAIKLRFSLFQHRRHFFWALSWILREWFQAGVTLTVLIKIDEVSSNRFQMELWKLTGIHAYPYILVNLRTIARLLLECFPRLTLLQNNFPRLLFSDPWYFDSLCKLENVVVYWQITEFFHHSSLLVDFAPIFFRSWVDSLRNATGTESMPTRGQKKRFPILWVVFFTAERTVDDFIVSFWCLLSSLWLDNVFHLLDCFVYFNLVD
jgi:hypothetical protein